MLSRSSLKGLLDRTRPLKVSVKSDLRSVVRVNHPRCLDYGCGRGPFKPALTDLGCQVYGIDISSSGAADFTFCDGLIPKNAGVFDLVVAFDVLQHIEDPKLALQDIYKNLRDGGVIYLTVPFLYPHCDFEDYHRWTLDGVHALLEGGGFDVTWVKTRAGLLETCFLGLQQYFFNFIIGVRRDWELDLAPFQKILILFIEIAFLFFLWPARVMDFLISGYSKGATMGWRLMAEKRS